MQTGPPSVWEQSFHTLPNPAHHPDGDLPPATSRRDAADSRGAGGSSAMAHAHAPLWHAPLWRAKRWLLRWTVATAAMLAPTLAPAAAETWDVAVDYAKLKSRLGPALPLGLGGAISQVESATPSHVSPPNAYFIDSSVYEFNTTFDPTGTQLTVIDGSGNAGNGVSNHSQGVANAYYGNVSSMAPGANNVTLYEAGHWLQSILNYTSSSAPAAQPFRVQNHSWVSHPSMPVGEAQSALRRLDYVIETEDMTAVVGANNDVTPSSPLAHPMLFAHSYNAIVVGLSTGAHSRGQTSSSYAPGRYRPDIVAPADQTSISTPRVGAAAALLHETAAGTDAARSETMKAILMAGATKDAPDFTTSGLGPWDRTSARPLDEVFGAGELNIYNSYVIQLGGQHLGTQTAGGVAAGSYGWDYQDLTGQPAAGNRYYRFEIPAGSTAQELSIMLAWNAEVTDTASGGSFSPDTDDSVQDLNLFFYNSSNLSVPIDQSTSVEHNVEHIYMTDLNPGSYTLKVTGAADWDYGLAWRMATQFDQISADFNGNGVVDGGDFLTWQRNNGTLLGATHGEGDADGDGDVDVDDLAAFRAGTIATPMTSASFFVGVPEPAAMALAMLALGCPWVAHRLFKHRSRRV